MIDCGHEYMEDGRCANCGESTEDILRAENKRLRELAKNMAKSVGCSGKAFKDYWDYVEALKEST